MRFYGKEVDRVHGTKLEKIMCNSNFHNKGIPQKSTSLLLEDVDSAV